MGVDVALTDKGPEIAHPVRNRADIDRLRTPDPAEAVPFVGSILKKLRTELTNEVPLVGFAGAPWTLASYIVEGGGSRNFIEIKGMAYREPRLLHALLEKIAETTTRYLLYQIESGAQAVQLFDTWAGELNRSDYEEFAQPHVRRIFEALGNRVPRILYQNGCSHVLESMAETGADVISVDWRIPIDEAKRRVGHRVALQGNLDPCLLLGTKDRLLARTEEILRQAGPTGHIMNLGHGILPPTPVEHARAFIDFAQGYRHAQ
jgi:uroporphyrinogen decarboxylase